MTKEETVENTLKCQLSVEDANRTGLDVMKLFDENVPALCNHQVFMEQEPKFQVACVVKKANPKRSKLEKATQKLYNLEPGNVPERSLNIELDLYQMEDY